MQVLHFKSMVTSHNPFSHPTFDIPPDELIDIFMDGLHPKAKLIAIKAFRDRANLNLNYPAVYAAHEVNAGAPHPLSGNCSIDALALYIHKEFNDLINAGELRLKVAPMINNVSESSDTATDQNTDCVYIAWDDVPHGSNLEQHAFAIFQRKAGKLRTCKRCGGVNHFEFGSDGKNCPTPEGSVDQRLLGQIRYPIDVNPWKFGGRGKGDGKGGGKGHKGGGKGYGKGGRGGARGGAFSTTEYWTQDAEGHWCDITEQYTQQPPVPPVPAPPSPTVEVPPPSPTVNVILVEDYDGWNS